MNTLVSSADEINKLLNEALPEIRELALAEFRRRADKYDLKLSEELYRSFKAAVLSSAADVQKEIVLSFNMYGRYKDLKYVDYTGYRTPNNKGKKYNAGNQDEPDLVLAMKEFINEVGIGKFKYIPGYTTNGSNRMPVTSRAIMRLAWTLATSRMKQARVKNRKKGWYNEARAVIVNKASASLGGKIRTAVQNAVNAQIMGMEVAVKI